MKKCSACEGIASAAASSNDGLHIFAKTLLRYMWALYGIVDVEADTLEIVEATPGGLAR